LPSHGAARFHRSVLTFPTVARQWPAAEKTDGHKLCGSRGGIASRSNASRWGSSAYVVGDLQGLHMQGWSSLRDRAPLGRRPAGFVQCIGCFVFR
jgi:hypothetical protein